ncbi:MAG: TRAP transporter substrate-binding protein DctP [bacterium]
MFSKKLDAKALVLLLLAVLFFWGGSPVIAASSEAQKPLLWRMAHYQPEQRVLMQGIKWWASELEKRTGGRIKIKHYFNEELARAKEILPLVARGGVELGTTSITYHPSEYPLLQVIAEYPCADLDELFWLIPRVVEEVPAIKAESKRNNVKILSYGGLPPYGVVCTKPINKLDDLKSFRVRVWGSMVPKRVAKLGMVPLALPSSEVYEAMAKGAVESTLSPNDQHKIGLWEIAKYHLKGDFYPACYAAQPLMNLNLFNSLAPDLQKTIMDLQVDHLKMLKQLISETDAEDEKFLKDKGVKFSYISQAENERLQKDSLEVWDQETAKLKIQDDVKAVKAAITRLKAEYRKTQ